MSGSSSLLGVIVGWLLGIGSHFIIDDVKRRREERQLRATLRTEFGELQYRMAVVVITVEMKLGTTNRASIELIRPIVAAYEGMNRSEEVLKFIDSTLNATDKDIIAMNKLSKLQSGVGISLQKYSIPMFEAKLGLLSLFEHNPQLQSQLLEVRLGLNMFNDLVDRARYFLELTFSNTSPTNHPRAVEGQDASCKLAVERAKILIRQIGKIKW